MSLFTSISLELNLNLCILEASTSKDPLASNTLLRASGFLPQVTPISSHRPAPATHDALPRPSARELFNCLPRSRRPEEEPGPSARELFNRLPQSRRPETTPSARDLFNRLPQSRRPDRPEAPRPSARELFNRLPQGHRLEAKPLGLSELYSALPRPSSPSSASTALGHLPPKPDNSLAGPKAVIDLTDDDDHDPIPPFEPIQPKGPISADTPLADLKAIHPSIFEEDRHQYIFNTTDDFATRQTKRSWAGSYHADDWVFAREELHADQVDRDRVLPILLWDAGYPAFVSLIFFFVFFYSTRILGDITARNSEPT